jgi:4-amino-4-deoxy-L-arabinose transferase-like glycosyltransferase
MIVWAIVAVIVAAPWYVMVAQQGVSTHRFIGGFVARQLELLRTGVAGHTGPWYFHLIVLALGCFPASIFAVSALGRFLDDPPKVRDFRLWMISLLIVVLAVFSLVQTKIVHYSSLAYFPITFLAALALTDVERAWWPRYFSPAAGAIGFVWAVVFLALPVVGLMIAHNQLDPMRVTPDSFARAVLVVPVGWSLPDLVVGGAYLATIVVALIVLQRRKDKKRFAVILFAATALVVPLALARIAPKIERYTQATPIAFYESLQGCDCYIAPLGFKSYAHLFYGRITPEHSARASGVGPDHFEEWLLSGPIDRPAYFVSKIDKADRWRSRPGLQVIGERNGFVFFRRAPR